VQLRCPDDVSGDTGGCSARRGIIYIYIYKIANNCLSEKDTETVARIEAR